MRQTKPELIAYRNERARECLDEAGILAGTNHLNAAVNRLYYACFYACSALFIQKDIDLDCKADVYEEFRKQFVQEGFFSLTRAEIFRLLYENKEDEEKKLVKKNFDPAQVADLINKTEIFVKTIFEEISKH